MGCLPFVPEQVLRARCEPVFSADEARRIISELQYRLNQLTDCVGLAAPQIGINKQVTIVRYSNYHLDIINPKIIDYSDPFVFCGEGCMSFPGRRWDVPRYQKIRIEVNAIWPPISKMSVAPKPTDSGQPELVVQTYELLYQHPSEDAPNLLPIIIQHECDHLAGVCLPWKEGVVESVVKPIINPNEKVGRNDDCPCGSGKKFKKCCLNNASTSKLDNSSGHF